MKAEGRQQKAEIWIVNRKRKAANHFSSSAFCFLHSAFFQNSACLDPPKAVHTPALRPQKACRTGRCCHDRGVFGSFGLAVRNQISLLREGSLLR